MLKKERFVEVLLNNGFELVGRNTIRKKSERESEFKLRMKGQFLNFVQLWGKDLKSKCSSQIYIDKVVVSVSEDVTEVTVREYV